MYGRILTKVSSTDWMQWGLYTPPRSRFSHTDISLSVLTVNFCWNACTSYHNDISLLHQEVFSSCIFSLASITMADHQEYFFTQFLSIQMVSSLFISYVSIWMCAFWCIWMIRFKTIRSALTLLSMDYRPSVRSRSLGVGQVHVYGRDRVKVYGSMNMTKKKNEANIQSSWLNKFGQWRIYYIIWKKHSIIFVGHSG